MVFQIYMENVLWMNILNLWISTWQISEIWHKAMIIPILKSGKDSNICKIWRPINLLWSDPNGSCIFEAGSSIDTVVSQSIRTSSTRQITFLVAERPMSAMLLRLSASVCRWYRSWPHWQWNRYSLSRPKPRNITSCRLMRRANNNNYAQRYKRWKNLPKIQTHIPFRHSKRSFRSKQSTCIALSSIKANIAVGFSRKNHWTVLVALDLTAAFDYLDHQQLLVCVYNINIPATIRRWLYNYVQNRRANVQFRQQESKSRKAKTGVAQGGVMSPALFNYYLADFPTPPPNIKMIKYADDIAICTSGQVVADLINGHNMYLSQGLNYININKTYVLTAKSTATLFTPDTHEHHFHPQVNLADQVLQLEKKPNVLGMTLRHSVHFYTTLPQYRGKSAAKQLCVESNGRLYLGLRRRNHANDLPGNWPLNTQLQLPLLDDIT